MASDSWAMTDSSVLLVTFYRFFTIDAVSETQSRLQDLCDGFGLLGTLIVAGEGVNGTLCGEAEQLRGCVAQLQESWGFAGVDFKFSQAPAAPFRRMDVRVRKEIVTFDEKLQPSLRTGEHVPPEQWNALIADPDVLLLDVRNQYEVDVGTFAGAVNPGLDTFVDLKPWVEAHLDTNKQRRVAMFCTGGIRCEKASAHLLEQGVESVYQLDGGILSYLEQVDAEQSQWQGDCFVFDHRVAVDQALDPTGWVICHGCRKPVSEQDQCLPSYEEGISCPACAASLTEDRRARLAERKRQVAAGEMPRVAPISTAR